jgi:UDP-N-acetyl-D-galactosamine dehydrogenase
MADPHDVAEEYGVTLSDFSECSKNEYDALILAVSHEAFKKYDLSNFIKNNAVIYDIKGILDRKIVSGRL